MLILKLLSQDLIKFLVQIFNQFVKNQVCRQLERTDMWSHKRISKQHTKLLLEGLIKILPFINDVLCYLL